MQVAELCAPWTDTLTLCPDLDDQDPPPPPELVERALAVASELLYYASGRRYRGVCDDTIRPCETGGRAWQWVTRPDGTGHPVPLDCRCATGNDPGVLGCGCTLHQAVRLPNTPVIEVTDVTIDGDALDPADWFLVDSRWLIRRNMRPWPCCQRLDLPDGDPGTWSISYRWGAPVPQAGVAAAEELACEFVKAWAPNGKGCRIPKRVTQIVREGVTWTLLDEFDRLPWQGYGLAAVAAFVQTFNPSQLIAPPKGIDPRTVGDVRRVR